MGVNIILRNRSRRIIFYNKPVFTTPLDLSFFLLYNYYISRNKPRNIFPRRQNMAFPVHFLLCNFIIILIFGGILLFKKVFEKYITPVSQYRIWYLFLLALVLPFSPFGAISPAQLISCISALFYRARTDFSSFAAPDLSSPSVAAQLGLSDLAVAAERGSFSSLIPVLCAVWGIGCVTALLYFLYSVYRIHSIRISSCPVTAETEPELYKVYRSCTDSLKIRRSIALYASCGISSPVSYGLFRPTVIIPQDMDIVLSEEDIRFIFLHELQHYRQKDALWNYLACILQTVYWFNPLVWYGFSLMRRDREFACDHSVIQTEGTEQAAAYGCTLIRYIERLHRNTFFSPLSGLGGRKSVIAQRIKKIVGYKTETRATKARGICVLLLAALLVYAASPLLTAYASSDSTYDFAGKNVETIDLSSYFHGTDGSFVLYDMSEDLYQIYNMEQSTVRVSPDSTFKIYSALFALEEGVISPDVSALAWDGTQYPFDTWNADQTLSTAMYNSVNWYFQILDSQIGYFALSEWYSRISYGNCDLSGEISDYWAESTLKISPVEQVILLARLLRNEWDLSPENIQAVKDAMFICDTPAGKLYGKTGTGMSEGENSNGWFVGFLENDGHTRCFALNLRGSENASGSAAAETVINILTDGLF